MSVWQDGFPYPISTRSEANSTVLSRNRIGKPVLSNTHTTKGGSTRKRRKWYVDLPKTESKTFMIHGAGHSSDECKVLGEFVTKYAA